MKVIGFVIETKSPGVVPECVGKLFLGTGFEIVPSQGITEDVHENVSQGSSQRARLTPKWVLMNVMSSTGKVLVLSVRDVSLDHGISW
jgi:hypothetical protein